jgi:hypothetical protein
MDAAALNASWGKVVAAGDGIPLYFHSHLSLRHPQLRSIFPIQMTAQRDKLWPPWALSYRTSTRSTTWCLCSSNWVVTTVASQ